MVFSSLLFLFVFLPLTVILYFVAPKKARCAVLLMCSLVFFAWGEQKYLLLMLFTVTVDYVAGFIIGILKEKGKKSLEKLTMILAVVINLGLLGVFKYADFIINTVNAVINTEIAPLSLVLPLGISFYTFQALSYVLDVYMGRCKYQPDYIKFAMYIALFPQLIAGPIVRYTDIEEQIADRSAKPDEIVIGIRRFVLGLGKKVLLANTAGALFETLSGYGSEMTVLAAILAALAYTFQIYFDFSGYSDMAIGLGHIFGFHFPENFNYPYESTSITDFWRRWHITLSTFFREYVYYPLGGSYYGFKRQIFNLLVVWTLTGIWHGAGWTFVLWGLYFFVILTIEKLFMLRVLEKAPVILRRVYSLVLIVFGWVIFSAKSVTDIGTFVSCLFGANGFADDVSIYYLICYLIPFVIYIIGSTHIPSKLASKLTGSEKLNENVSIAIQCVAVVAILFVSTAFIAGDGYNPFLYFRF